MRRLWPHLKDLRGRWRRGSRTPAVGRDEPIGDLAAGHEDRIVPAKQVVDHPLEIADAVRHRIALRARRRASSAAPSSGFSRIFTVSRIIPLLNHESLNRGSGY